MERKLESMVLLIADRCSGHRNFSRAMLCRLCYFADFDHYELHGASVSGCGYVIRGGGPEPLGIDDVLESMARRRLVRIRVHSGEVRVVPLARPDGVLSGEEARSVESAVSRYSGMNERLLSWISRGDAPCAGRAPMDVLDYAAVSCRSPATSAKVLQKGEA